MSEWTQCLHHCVEVVVVATCVFKERKSWRGRGGAKVEGEEEEGWRNERGKLGRGNRKDRTQTKT